MRKIYLILTVIICLSIILFVATFFYIDTHRHTAYHYKIYQDNRLIAAVELDKYNTEDKLVYKSATKTPFHSTATIHKRKLSIDKPGGNIHAYNKKSLSEGVGMDVYIRRVDSNIDFLAIGHSNFAYAKRLPLDKDFIIFEDDALVSYFNMINTYDFKKRGIQSIPALTHTYTFLPPIKTEVQLRFIDEELITLNDKNIKALRMAARLPDKKEILIWANRWTRVPLLVKIPKLGFEAVWSESPEEITAKRYTIENSLYENRKIVFKSKDVNLAGTLSLPKGKGPFPAAVLIWGPGPLDRDALGMFTDIADGLAKNGIATLRFDKRGVGESEGNFSKFTGNDMYNDISAAIDFLIQQKEIDKNKIAVLGHSDGGYYATSLAVNNSNVSACIVMAGIEALNLPDTDLEMMWSFDKSSVNWGEDYMKDIAKTAQDTSEILKSGKDWAMLLHKRVFLKKCQSDIARKPLDVIRKIKVPILILRGRKDTVIPQEHIELLDSALKESGNKKYEIIYFNRLNHFFGKKIEDGIHRTHLAIDEEVLSTILKWLGENLISPPKEEPLKITVSEEIMQQGQDSDKKPIELKNAGEKKEDMQKGAM